MCLIITFSWNTHPEFMIQSIQELAYFNTHTECFCWRLVLAYIFREIALEGGSNICFLSLLGNGDNPLIRCVWSYFSQKLFIKYLLKVCFYTGDDFVNTIIFLPNLSNLCSPLLSGKLVLNSVLFMLILVENWFPVQQIHFLCEQTHKYSCGSAQNHKSPVFDLFNSFISLAFILWINLCKDVYYELTCMEYKFFKTWLWSAVALYYWSLRIKFRKHPHGLAPHTF